MLTLNRSRFLVALAALLAASTARTSFAQDPAPTREPVQRVAPETLVALRAKLADAPTSAAVAWGAWETAEAGARELVPDLVSALRRTLGARVDDATPFVLRAELDALIRLDARLSAEDLARVTQVGSVRTQALVLAARDTTLHANAIEAMRVGSRNEERIAIDNLLAAGVPARLVALLLPDARVRITVRVFDEGGGSGGGSHMSGTGCGSLKAPEGFPPTVIYSLRRGAAKDVPVFADGPQPIAYAREVHGEREFGVGGRSEGLDDAEHALRLLRWVAKDPDPKSFLAAQVDVRHAWKDRQHYINEVSVAIEARTKAWRALVDELVRRKLLDAKQVPAKDPIDVVVEDHRENQSVALPALVR